MAYEIVDNSIVEIQSVGLLNGQTTRNVFHYGLVTGGGPISDGHAALNSIANAVADTWWTQYLACISNQWTLQYIQCQWIWPVRTRLRRYTGADLVINTAGDVDSPAQANSVTACVSLFTLVALPSGQGRRFIPGLPTTFNDQSVLSVAGVLAYSNLASALVSDLHPALPAPFTLRPILLKEGFIDLNSQLIIDWEVNVPLRSQRRREVGRGE